MKAIHVKTIKCPMYPGKLFLCPEELHVLRVVRIVAGDEGDVALYRRARWWHLRPLRKRARR